jgi:hypothetical protein
MDQHQNPDKVASGPIQGEPPPAAPFPNAGLDSALGQPLDLRTPWWQYPITVVVLVIIVVVLFVALLLVISMASQPTSSGAWTTSKAKEPFKKDASLWQPYVGRWTLKDDKGEVSGYFNLSADKTATKDNVPDARGTWDVFANECRITWSDGSKDILRPQPDGVLKLSIPPGKWFFDEPDNIQHATREPLK